MKKETSMKHLKLFLMVAGVITLASMAGRAGDLKVIANASVSASSISADDLKSVFLEEKTSLSDGSHVDPVLLKGGPAHEAFVKQYLGKSDDALQTYYRSLVFSGKGSMPKMLGSDTEVLAYVAKTKGAIGYVSAGAIAEFKGGVNAIRGKLAVVLQSQLRQVRGLRLHSTGGGAVSFAIQAVTRGAILGEHFLA